MFYKIIYFIKNCKCDIINDILEAPGYRITNKCIVVSYLGNKPYCLRPYKSKHGSNVVDLLQEENELFLEKNCRNFSTETSCIRSENAVQ